MNFHESAWAPLESAMDVGMEAVMVGGMDSAMGGGTAPGCGFGLASYPVWSNGLTANQDDISSPASPLTLSLASARIASPHLHFS